MPTMKTTAATALAGLVALSACTDVNTATDNPRQRTIGVPHLARLWALQPARCWVIMTKTPRTAP